MKLESLALHCGYESEATTKAAAVPIYQTTSYTFDNTQHGADLFDLKVKGNIYTRIMNPTTDVLEQRLAAMEGGIAGLAVASGMAAITAFFMGFSQGDHLIVSRDIYGGTYRLLTALFSNFGITADFVDTGESEAVERAVKGETRAVLLETPGNPLMSISNIREISAITRKNNILLAVDNTFLTPALQRPLELGADIVLHSATKYLGGHNDLSGGALVTAGPELGEEYSFIQNAAGSILSPGDCWLLARSIKTLPLRMKAHSEGAMKIARWLREQKRVKAVYYPGLEDHPGHAVCGEQASGFGGMISFRVESASAAAGCLERVRLVSFAESLGGVETLITLPAVQTHGDIPESVREKLGVTGDLLRLSVGLEDPHDIIQDLDAAING